MNCHLVKHSDVAISLLCFGSPVLSVHIVCPLHKSQCSCHVRLSCFLLFQSTPSRQTIPNEISGMLYGAMRTAVSQWLRCCVTNRKVAGSIPDGVTETLY